MSRLETVVVVVSVLEVGLVVEVVVCNWIVEVVLVVDVGPKVVEEKKIEETVEIEVEVVVPTWTVEAGGVRRKKIPCIL